MTIGYNIGSYGFRDDMDIDEVDFSSSVDMLGHSSFAFCGNLKSVDMSNSNIRHLNYCEFRNCVSLEHVKLPKNLNRIGYESFRRCYSLKEMYIPETVRVIEINAFKQCRNLMKINLPFGITWIKSGIFYDCTKLSEVKIPSTVTRIDDYAFRSCISIQRIEIPRYCNVAKYAFAGCDNLKEIVFNEIS